MGDTSLFTQDDLHHQREKIRRSFLRANSALAVVLVAVLGLTVAAVMASARASRSQQRAEAAELDAREKLWNAYLAQAQTARLTGRRGRRMQSLTAIRNATAIRGSVPLRNEAIATLVSPDLEIEGEIYPQALPYRQAFQFGLRHYAISASDGEVSVFRTQDHSEIARLTKSAANIPNNALLAGFEFTRDGRHLLEVFRDGTCVIWDLETTRPFLVRKSPGGGVQGNIELSGDGRLCIAERLDAKAQVTVIDLKTGNTQVLPVTSKMGGASLRPGKKQLAVAVGQEVQLFELGGADPIATFSNPEPIKSPVWSSDGNHFAVSAASGAIYLWNVVNGRFFALSGHTESVRLMVYSPDNTILMTTAWDNTTRFWDVQTGRTILTCEGELGSEFSEDGQRVGFARLGSGVGTWRFSNNPVLQTLQPLPAPDAVMNHYDLSPDGRWLAAVVKDGVQLWNIAQTNRNIVAPVGEVTALNFHPKTPTLLICHPGSLELREVTTNTADGLPALGQPRTIALPQNCKPRQATLSLDGRTILAEGQDLVFTVIDALGERPPVKLDGQQWWLNGLTPASGTGSGRTAISPDGKWVAVGYSVGPTNLPSLSGASQWAGIWDAQTGRRVFTPEHMGGVTFSPDNRWFILRSDADCHLYKTGTWEHERVMHLDNLATHIGSTAMPQNGRWLAASRSRQLVELLEPGTGTELAQLVSPATHSVTRLRCASDGSLIAVGTANGQILLWNLTVLRQELAGLGLDWEGKIPLANNNVNPNPGPAFPDPPTEMILAGLTGAGVTIFIGLLVLRWHRQLIQNYVRTEATVEKRKHQLEMAKLELLQAEKMKALGTLAAGIAHDFNNLLSVIRMSNQLIPRAHSPAEVAEYVTTVERAVLQGKKVVSSMLGYSRHSALDDQPCNIGSLVEQTALLLTKEFLSGINLKLELAPAIPPVQMDKSKLQQAILNLVVNAAEAMKGSGTLVLSVQPLGQLPEIQDGRFATRPRSASRFVQVTVSDSGPGIAPEIIDRIFEPFFTTKNTGTQVGTGLGLSLVHTAALQQGLGLAVKSKPGEGATFFLFIPVNEAAEKTNSNESSG